MKKNKAFSLIEVVMATFILSVAVFGIYKLIAENTKIINNSDEYTKASFLFAVVENCIENTDYKTWYLDLWIDLKECNFNPTEKINTIDNVDYTLKYENNIISVSSDFIWTLTWEYKK